MSEGNFEAKISGKRESGNGIFITLQIAPDDYTADIATLRVGATLMVGWAELVNSAVEPIKLDPPAQRQPEHRKFCDLPLCAQAGIRCEDQTFKEFVFTTTAQGLPPEEFVRRYCNVDTRAKILPGTEAGDKWAILESRFQAWLTDRRYGGEAR